MSKSGPTFISCLRFQDRHENADIPTDGQLSDALEAAAEKMADGYCCQDVELRKRLAIALSDFVNENR